jgi:flagellar motor switch protein FliM
MSANPPRYDFRERRLISPTAIRVLERWMADAMTLGNDVLRQHCGGGVLHSPTITTADSRSHVSELPEPGFGFEVHFGSERATSLVAISQSLALELVVRILGGREPGDSPEADRELSRAELAVLEMLLQQLLPAIVQAWPADAPPQLVLAQVIERPSRSRLLGHAQPTIKCDWTLDFKDFSAALSWVLPQEATARLIDSSIVAPPPKLSQESRPLAALARVLPMTAVVELGSTDLKVSEISRLQVGDVLLLNQSIHKPMVCRVAGQPKFGGHPGRVGTHRAFEIRGLLSDPE